MQFVDKCKILIKAGDGGDGLIAWRREAHVAFGGPAGGDGGKGGDVYLLADHNESTLFNLRYTKEIRAQNGVNGQTENKTGANGLDTIIKVPIGTVVYNNNEFVVDLNKDKQLFLICKGGKGGFGNTSFKSNYTKAPYMYERGEKGEKKEITLELKEIADIGLIGLPNAGKSTFIKTICNVNVKIGNYPFTTIHPVLGTYFYKNNSIIFCDIPGLIEGAAEGKGLGHEFLKHVERCKILLHLVSGDINDNEDIIEAYNTICNELDKYNRNLEQKKIFIVVTKSDTESAELQYSILKEYLKNKNVYLISCNTGDNLNEFLNMVLKEFTKLQDSNSEIIEINHNDLSIIDNSIIKIDNIKDKKIDYLNINDEKLKIYKDDNNLIHIQHPILQYWTHRIPNDTRDNILRFNQKMYDLKLNETLKKHNLKKDDTVIIDDYGIEWIID